MNDKAKKPQKLRARLPRGLADKGAAELAATRAMTETIRAVYERYGFDPVETPAFEYTDALGKFLPDQDRPNEGVFSFQDDDEQWISLRYDLTAPLARYVAENYQHLAMPYRSYRAGYVYRNEKPGPGRFRQFMQFDADTVGSASPAADAEMCMMAADAMEALGFQRGQYVVKVNSRKVLDGVMESIGLGGDENAGRRLTVLRAIDKLDKFSVEEVRKLLGEGRWDGGEEGKGDFTKGAKLDEDQIHEILTLAGSQPGASNQDEMEAWEAADTIFAGGAVEIDSQGQTVFGASRYMEPGPGRAPMRNEATIQQLRAHFAGSDLITEGIDELEAISSLAHSSKYGTKRILIDPSVVRGLEYYTGAVFEVELLLETKDERGRPVRFGSVGGGGRYDGLVSRFMGQPVPATGFSIGVSRLQAALALVKKSHVRARSFGPVVVTVFDKDRIADYQKLVQTLRSAPIDSDKPKGPRIRAELYLGNPKNMGNQLKYADKRNSPCVIIQGSDELDHDSGEPHLIIKDLIVGSGVAEFHAATESELSTKDFRSEQKAQAQQLVAVSDLVTAVRALLVRHGVNWSLP